MHLNLFGRRRASKAEQSSTPRHGKNNANANNKTDTIDSLARMRSTVSDLEKREQFLQVKANAQLEEAMAKNKAGDKNGALTAMTRKKMFEKEVQNIIQMKSNLEAQMLSIESANVTLVAHEGMRVGVNAQRLANKNLNPDEIADLHQDIEDHLNQANEAATILSGSYNAGEIYDENDLLAELHAEMATETTTKYEPSKIADDKDDVEALAKMMSSIPTVPEGKPLPLAPTTELLVPPRNEDEDDLRRLEQEMGL